MNKCAFACMFLTVASCGLMAQSSNMDHSLTLVAPITAGSSSGAGAPVIRNAVTVGPFSRIALGAGISPLGVNLAATTNVNKYINLRGTGNVFRYSVDNISTDGIDATAKLNLASAGISVDFYPFPMHGLRLSPGLLFYNSNALDGTISEAGGSDFTLNGTDYVSSTTNPVKGTASVGLHTNNPAFTITTGWGNQISRRGGHLSFPFELGIAVIGTPDVKLALTSGQACDFEGHCQNVATYKQLQTDLAVQAAKYKHDLDPLKTYPILSFGVAYNFRIRK